MPGALGEILSGDGGHVYLGDRVFDKSGKPSEEGSPHLFALTGFLDDSRAHRSYWIFGTECSLATGCTRRERDLVYGRLIAFDDSTVYGYGRQTVHWSNALQDGAYRLFAVDRSTGEPRWTKRLGIRAGAMILAGDLLFVAGEPLRSRESPGEGGAEGSALLVALSAEDGTERSTYRLDAPPVLDGMAAAGGRLYVTLHGGRLLCLEGKAPDDR
jgi:outer membrane protein assembly factor BamB